MEKLLDIARVLVVSNARRDDTIRPRVRNYVIHWIRHPDHGSTFERKTRWFRWCVLPLLPQRFVLWYMLRQHYNGLLFEHTHVGGIVVHVFFQRRGDALHMFSVSTNPEYRGRRYALQALVYFITYAYGIGGITRVRLGAGGHEAVVAIVDKLGRKLIDLPFAVRVTPDGWVHFTSKCSL